MADCSEVRAKLPYRLQRYGSIVFQGGNAMANDMIRPDARAEEIHAELDRVTMTKKEKEQYREIMRAEQDPLAIARRRRGTRRVEAVVFDMDGVIFDTEALDIVCWREMAARHGLKCPDQPCHDAMGANMRRVREIFLAYYGQDFPFDAYQEEWLLTIREMTEHGAIRLMKGVRELLSYLKKTGVAIALASSTERERVMRELRLFDLDPYFNAIICGDMVHRSKPDPDIYLMACREAGVRPECAFAIEDSYNGIRSAHAAGMHPIMVPDLLPPDQEMAEKAEVILPDLLAVIAYLRALR
jgi:HAD superfamily hydrolase (TIGR01509 family)